MKVIQVKKIISSRYNSEERPSSWDDRIAGIDQIESDDGQIYDLISSGQQSTPKPGWGILLQEQKPEGFTWTLYSMS